MYYKTSWKDVCDMFPSHIRTRDITVTKCTFLYHDPSNTFILKD